MKMVNTRIYMLYLTLSPYDHTTSHFDFPTLKLSNLNNLAFLQHESKCFMNIKPIITFLC